MTPSSFSEQQLVERPALALLASSGTRSSTPTPSSSAPTRSRAARPAATTGPRSSSATGCAPKLAELNPELPVSGARRRASSELLLDRSAMDRVRANRAVWKLLRDGAKVTFATDDGGRARPRPSASSTGRRRRNNDFLAVSQFWVVGPLHTRRCDIVCFVNGIPLVLLELKASHKTVEHAYTKNLRDYRDTIPQLFTPNALGDPLERLGDEGRLDVRAVGALRRVEADRRRGTSPASCRSRRRSAALCEPARLLDMVENFVAYLERPGGLVKVARAEPPGPRRQRGDASAARSSARARAGSASSGTRRARARASRCCSSRRRSCAASPATGPS